MRLRNRIVKASFYNDTPQEAQRALDEYAEAHGWEVA